MKRVIRIYFIACLVFAGLGIISSLVYYTYLMSFGMEEIVLHKKYTYFLRNDSMSDPAILVYDKEHAELLIDWYKNKDSSVHVPLPVSGNAFFVVPVNTRVDVVGYYNDSSIVQVKMDINRGNLDPEVNGFVVRAVLHEDPWRSRNSVFNR